MTAMLLKYKLRSILSDPVRECLCLIRSAVRFWFFSHVCQFELKLFNSNLFNFFFLKRKFSDTSKGEQRGLFYNWSEQVAPPR